MSLEALDMQSSERTLIFQIYTSQRKRFVGNMAEKWHWATEWKRFLPTTDLILSPHLLGNQLPPNLEIYSFTCHKGSKQGLALM